MGSTKPVLNDAAPIQVIDHSGDTFSTSYEAAAAVAIGDVKRIKVIVDLTTQGSVTSITVKNRTSTLAAPTAGTATDWSTRQWHATAGSAAASDYEPVITVSGAGRFEFVFDVDGLWCSPMVKVNNATSSRGSVYVYRSRGRG